jgi:hypothetical protein
MMHLAVLRETDSLKSVGSVSGPAIPGRKHLHRRERFDRHGQACALPKSPISPTLLESATLPCSIKTETKSCRSQLDTLAPSPNALKDVLLVGRLRMQELKSREFPVAPR